MAISPYSFPEKNKFRAKEVTQPDFDISLFQFELYINFDEVRRELYDLENIRFTLNLDGEMLFPPTTYSKIIFSGHAGCGKTLEPRRFHEAVHHPDRYFSVLINLEEETDLARFEAEDLFVFLITKLIERMREAGLHDIPDDFEKLPKDWLSTKESQKEFKKTFGLDLDAEASVGFSFWSFLSAKSGFKTLFSGQSETIQTIRYKIKENPNELIERFNAGLYQVRQDLSRANQGIDILFIVNGSEKMKYITYQKIFVDDSQMIRDVAANMICCVPINSFYQINNSLVKDYFEPVILPMVPLNDQSRILLQTVITRRVIFRTLR